MKTNILFVDDDEILSAVYRNIFMKEGMCITEAENGAKALAALKVGKFDIVITDIFMPVMDGIDLIYAIRANYENETLPIITMTAANGDGVLERALSAGANVVYLKPIDDKILLAKVNELVKRTVSKAVCSHLEIK